MYHFLAHLWCAYAIPMALSVVRRPSSVVCVVSSNLTTADMKEIIKCKCFSYAWVVPPRYWWRSLHWL